MKQGRGLCQGQEAAVRSPQSSSAVAPGTWQGRSHGCWGQGSCASEHPGRHVAPNTWLSVSDPLLERRSVTRDSATGLGLLKEKPLKQTPRRRPEPAVWPMTYGQFMRQTEIPGSRRRRKLEWNDKQAGPAVPYLITWSSLPPHLRPEQTADHPPPRSKAPPPLATVSP